jgi:hypothetical protein
LTPGNHREVLDSARGKKKREIDEIVARLSPRPDVAASVRKLPVLRLADTRSPRPSRAKDPRARHASAAVKRAVWVRDLGRCGFIGTNGHRCNERRFLEFHHVDPHALGGETSVDKIELRCRRHNDYEGGVYFGKRRRDERFDPGNLFQNKLAGGASPSARSGVEPQP